MAPLLASGMRLALRDAQAIGLEPASSSAAASAAGADDAAPSHGTNVDAWARSVLESLGVSPHARGTGGAPLGIRIDGHGDDDTTGILGVSRLTLPHRPGTAAAKTATASFGPDHPAAASGQGPPRRPPSRRDSQRRREALLKGKEGSRQRRRWENDRLLHVPNAQPPLPTDWEVRPTHPVHYGLPYHIAQYWDKGLRQQVNETRAAAAVLRRRQIVAHQSGTAGAPDGPAPSTSATSSAAAVRVGTVTREFRATAKKTPAVKTWMRVLEEPVRAFVVAAAAARAAGRSLDGSDVSDASDLGQYGPDGSLGSLARHHARHGSLDDDWTTAGEDSPLCSDEDEDDEIVFVGRRPVRAKEQRQMATASPSPSQPADAGIVMDELGSDRDGSFKRWLTHSISDYYGLASHSVSVESPPRRVVYVTLREEMRTPAGPPLLVPRPMWELF